MADATLTTAIERVAGGEDLSADEAAAAFALIMDGAASDVQIAALLIALRAKGETVAELAGLARTMRDLTLRVETDGELVDTAGTGGGRPTFNISTTAAFVAAGAGCRMAKHGNRSATSRCGSADVLEALGAVIDLSPAAIATCIEEVGFGFMFAPRHHAATRHVVPVRKELAVRTIFNFLGPLTNPAGASRQLIGVSDGRYLTTIAAALRELGTESALVVSSADGLDEISASGPTRVVELKSGRLEEYEVTPEGVGVESFADAAVGAGSPQQNAAVTRGVLAGAGGPERALTVLNAGAAIYVGGGAESIEAGVRRAERAIDDGAAADVLERFVARSRALARETAA